MICAALFDVCVFSTSVLSRLGKALLPLSLGYSGLRVSAGFALKFALGFAVVFRLPHTPRDRATTESIVTVLYLSYTVFSRQTTNKSQDGRVA